MKYLFVLLSIAMNLPLNAQESELRKIDVLGNKVAFKEILHASIYFEINGKVLYIDPWGDEQLYQGLEKADAILITDIHPDHYSPENIKLLLKDETFFIAPMAVYDLLPSEWKSRCSVLNNGEQMNFKDIRLMVIATPMYNMPDNESQGHVIGRGNGYILDVDDFRILISGDTGNTPELQAQKDIDLAFVCMNLPYTMSVEDAIEATKTFKPKKVIPYHYRNGDKSLSDVDHFCEEIKKEGIKCQKLDWYSNE